MESRLLCAVGACLLLFPFLANAATVVYSDRDAFYGQLGTVVLDDYDSTGYPAGMLTGPEMTAVLAETTYMDTFSMGVFLVNSSNANAASRAWCNGCNLSTVLDFTSTSVGDSVGVFNVGFDIVGNAGDIFDANVTFGDGSTHTYTLPAVTDFSNGSPYGFWGINSSLKITRVGLLGTGAFDTFLVVDNLVIGGSGGGVTAPPLQVHGGVIPIPPAVWLFASGLLGLVGMARRKTVQQEEVRSSINGNL